jgi:hypothetical protein
MTGLVRKATLLTAGCLLLVAGAAMAGVPSQANSSIGNVITWGTTNAGGTVDPLVQKTITVRDGSNNVVQNSTVVINFTTCTAGANGIRLASTQPFAGLLLSCANRTVTAITNASGVATFRIVGHANNAAGLNSPGLGTTDCATVQADGNPLGTLSTAAYDHDGVGGVNVTDLGNFLADRFGSYRQRSDYDGNDVLNVTDLGAFLAVRFGGGSTQAVGATCAP